MIGDRVDVYMNLNKGCYSVKCMDPDADEYGNVIDHVDRILIDDPEFVVQPSGLRRMRRSGKRNVHAFVRGVVEAEEDDADFGEGLRSWAFDYEPLHGAFMHTERPFVLHEAPVGRPIDHLDRSPDKVLLTENGQYALFDFTLGNGGNDT